GKSRLALRGQSVRQARRLAHLPTLPPPGSQPPWLPARIACRGMRQRAGKLKTGCPFSSSAWSRTHRPPPSDERPKDQDHPSVSPFRLRARGLVPGDRVPGPRRRSHPLGFRSGPGVSARIPPFASRRAIPREWDSRFQPGFAVLRPTQIRADRNSGRSPTRDSVSHRDPGLKAAPATTPPAAWVSRQATAKSHPRFATPCPCPAGLPWLRARGKAFALKALLRADRLPFQSNPPPKSLPES